MIRDAPDAVNNLIYRSLIFDSNFRPGLVNIENALADFLSNAEEHKIDLDKLVKGETTNALPQIKFDSSLQDKTQKVYFHGFLPCEINKSLITPSVTLHIIPNNYKQSTNFYKNGTYLKIKTLDHNIFQNVSSLDSAINRIRSVDENRNEDDQTQTLENPNAH